MDQETKFETKRYKFPFMSNWKYSRLSQTCTPSPPEMQRLANLEEEKPTRRVGVGSTQAYIPQVIPKIVTDDYSGKIHKQFIPKLVGL